MLDFVIDLAADLFGDLVVESSFAGLIELSKLAKHQTWPRQQTSSVLGLI
jgi:hypothetical protein